jgi:starvation-inducible DNA-binding protein
LYTAKEKIMGNASNSASDHARDSRWSADNGDTTIKITPNLNTLSADVFTLYLKTKNFHWHMSGPHLRDYHVVLDDQAEQLLATANAIAERVRKIGGSTLRSAQHIMCLARLAGNEADTVDQR